jgi:hypothetical protein
MRKIIDPSYMSSPKLRDYLERGRDNTVAITDFTANDSIRASVLEKLLMTTEIISRYPHQVSILKYTAAIVQLDARGSGQQNRFIDAAATTWFSQEFCKLRPQAKKGSVIVQKKLLGSRQQDLAQAGIIMSDARHIAGLSSEISGHYTADERERILAGYAPEPSLALRIIADIRRIAQEMSEKHPDGGLPDELATLRHTFSFKFAAAAFMIITGHGDAMKPETARDAVGDMHHAVYGLFFDGLLTDRAIKTKLHTSTKALVAQLENL